MGEDTHQRLEEGASGKHLMPKSGRVTAKGAARSGLSSTVSHDGS